MTRKVEDNLTVERFQKMPIEQQVKLLNSRLEVYFQTKNDQKRLRIDEKYVIKDAWFQMETATIRKRFGLVEYLDFSEYEQDPEIVEDWLIKQIAKRDIDRQDSEYHEYQKQLSDAIGFLLLITKLPIGWFDYALAYIALGTLPTHTEIQREPLIEVESIYDEGVTLKMEKGLKYDDFAQAWKALKPFFRQPSCWQPRPVTLSSRIYLDRKKGQLVSQIAETYFGEQYKDDPFSANDRVKKILARFK